MVINQSGTGQDFPFIGSNRPRHTGDGHKGALFHAYNQINHGWIVFALELDGQRDVHKNI
jgi:hypothetical protein